MPIPFALAAGFLGFCAMSVVPALAPLGLRPTLVLAELALAAPALLFLRLAGIHAAAGLALDRPAPRRVLASLALGAALWALSLGVLELQSVAWPPPPGYLETFRRLHALLRPHGPLDVLVSVGAIAVAPAVMEETLFRGVLLASLMRLGTATAVAGSALLFGAIHLDWTAGSWVLYRVPFAVVVGIGFGLLRVRSGGLLAPILAHAVVNAITFVAAPLLDDPQQAVPDPEPLKGAAFLLAGALLAWLLLRAWPSGAAPGATSEPSSRAVA